MARSGLLVVFFVAALATAQQRITEGELKLVSAAGFAGEKTRGNGAKQVAEGKGEHGHTYS
jgi:hypothetical protein